MLSEAKLVAALMKALGPELPGYVIIKHHDTITAGVPDLSVTGRGRTTWLEVKYANPKIYFRGAQSELMKKLYASGSAFYVVYRENPDAVEIVAPSNLEHPILTAAGHDHRAVAAFINRQHA